jgi:hypothetical protein
MIDSCNLLAGEVYVLYSDLASYWSLSTGGVFFLDRDIDKESILARGGRLLRCQFMVALFLLPVQKHPSHSWSYAFDLCSKLVNKLSVQSTSGLRVTFPGIWDQNVGIRSRFFPGSSSYFWPVISTRVMRETYKLSSSSYMVIKSMRTLGTPIPINIFSILH